MQNQTMDNIFSPNTLTLITTYKCTAACASCCFGCNPKRDKMMSEQEMLSYIDECIKHYPEIKILVLTGGEVFTLGLERICKIISYTKKTYGILTRIVSNGFWAYSDAKTREIILHLSEAGLDELNLSTGDAHCEFVPIENIHRVIDFNENNTALRTLCIMVERHKEEFYSIEKLNDWIQNKFGSKHKTITLESPWIDLSKHKDWNNFTLEGNPISNTNITNYGCGNLYAGIQINPYGQCLACCGFASEYSPFFKIGNININKKDLRGYLEEKHNDLLFMWLHTVGPRYIYKKIYGIEAPPNKHVCEVCLKLVTSAESVKYITQIIERESKNIYTNFLQTKLRNEKEKYSN